MLSSANATKNKQWVILIGGLSVLVIVIIIGMWVSDPNKGKPTPMEIARLESEEVKNDYKARSVEAVTPKERWIAKSEEELAEYKAENRMLRQEQDAMKKKLEDMEKLIRSGTNRTPTTIVPPNSTPIEKSANLPPPPVQNRNIPVMPPGGQQKNTSNGSNILPPIAKNKPNKNMGIQVFDFDDENIKEEEVKRKNISHYLPSGSFGKIVLLSGVDAPTGGEAESNPVPVLMRLLDHGTLPNYFKSGVKDCHITGSVRGDIASERGKIRTEKLSCILDDGDVIEVNVKGWVNGEDGKEGFRGKVVEKSGSLLARSFLAGTFSGLGENITSQYQNISQNPLGTVTSIDPSDAGKAALSTGISSSMEKLSDYYMDRANEMYPIIEIGANRIGEIVLNEGVDFGTKINRISEGVSE